MREKYIICRKSESKICLSGKNWHNKTPTLAGGGFALSPKSYKYFRRSENDYCWKEIASALIGIEIEGSTDETSDVPSFHVKALKPIW